MLWIINGTIKFDPDKHKLFSLGNPDLNVTLTIPASRCLTLLLEHSPDVVAQKDFLTQVWGEEGMIVPVNTLYQNISIIRRGLRVAGETDETLVSTVPRKGFRIDNSVKVTRISAHDTATDSGSDVELRPEESPVVVNAVVNPNKNSAKQPKQSRYPIMMLMVLVSFAAGVLALQASRIRISEPDFFKGYTINRVENGCHFISKNDDIKKVGNFTKFKNIIIATGLDCEKYPWVYFSSTSPMPALSAFVCKEPFEVAGGSGCITLYFRGGKH